MIADFSDLGVRDPECLRLAQLASEAVDFVKSGVPVSRKELPHPLRYTPDFMAREDETEKYLSVKALGEMFRAVPVRTFCVNIKAFCIDIVHRSKSISDRRAKRRTSVYLLVECGQR